MTLDSLLGGATKLLNTAATGYQTVTNLKEGPAPVAPAPVSPAGTFAQPKAGAWYQAAWVMPAALIAAGVLVLSLVIRRK